MSLEVDATTDVHVFPPVLARNLISGQAGTAAARAHLGALAELSPRTADGVAVDLVMETLGLIRDGHTDPARLAGDVFRVCSAAGGEVDAVTVRRGAVLAVAAAVLLVVGLLVLTGCGDVPVPTFGAAVAGGW